MIKVPIGEAIKRLEDVVGEVTAAVLFIPVALAFQDCVHATFRILGPMRIMMLGAIQLACLLLLAVLGVVILSLGVLHLDRLGSNYARAALLLGALVFVAAFAVAGGVANDKSGLPDTARYAALGSFIPVCAVALSVFRWEGDERRWWIESANVVALVCVFAIALPIR